MTLKNEEECFSRIQKDCKDLMSLKVSLKAKSYLINTKIISTIIFLAGASYISENTLNQIDNIISNFYWDGKPPKLKRTLFVVHTKMGA